MALPPEVERYRVPGGGALVVGIEAGDRVTLSDVEGRQPCELAVSGADGRLDTGLIGA